MRLAEFRTQELEKEIGLPVSFSAYVARLVAADLREAAPKLFALYERAPHSPEAMEELRKFLADHRFILEESDKHVMPASRAARIRSYSEDKRKQNRRAKRKRLPKLDKEEQN